VLKEGSPLAPDMKGLESGIQEPSCKEVFPNPMIFLPILDELKNLDFGGMRRNP
jgi:hypothetical protein